MNVSDALTSRRAVKWYDPDHNVTRDLAHLVKNQVLYQCHVLCEGNLSIALQRIVSVRITIRQGQLRIGGMWGSEFQLVNDSRPLLSHLINTNVL
jgi:hypothetical protein